MATDADGMARRPVAARRSWWAAAAARRLTRSGIRPNQVSVLSVVCAAAAGAALVAGAHSAAGWRVALLFGAVIGVELRLLCNLHSFSITKTTTKCMCQCCVFRNW